MARQNKPSLPVEMTAFLSLSALMADYLRETQTQRFADWLARKDREQSVNQDEKPMTTDEVRELLDSQFVMSIRLRRAGVLIGHL